MASYAQENSDNSICIVNTEQIESHTDYVIEVRMGGYHWVVKHRYSEFHEMHEQLVAKYNIDKKLLPPKKAFGNTSESFIQKRRGGLERYLQALFRQFEMIPFQLAMFLDFQKYEINGVTQILAETLFSRGESLLEKDSVCSMDPLQLHAITDRMTKPQTVVSNPSRDIGHILDFVTRLQKLRVIGTEKAVGTSNINMNNLEYSLSMFKSMKYLEVVKCNVTKINGLDHARQNVEKLKIKKSITSLQDFLTHNILYWEDESGGQTQQNTTWPLLTWVDLSENCISELPECMRYLQRMEYLDLHDNYLEDIDNLESLSYLTHLDVSINKIKHLSDLHLRLGNVKSINLAGNSLETLEGFSRLFSLEYLDVSNNQISQVIELRFLSSLPLLETLIITGNPVTVIPDYRIQVLKIFTDRAKQITLDNKKADEKELDTIAVLLALDHAKQPSKLKQPMKGGLKTKSSNSSDMISQTAGAAEGGASVSAVTEVTGVTDNADQPTKNKPPSQLPELVIASTPPMVAAHRFDSPFNSPARSSPESEQPFHSLSSSDGEGENNGNVTAGGEGQAKADAKDRSPPDGASGNHEDKLPNVVPVSSAVPSSDTATDTSPDTAAVISPDTAGGTEDKPELSGSGRSSPCVMYSVESGEEGRSSPEHADTRELLPDSPVLNTVAGGDLDADSRSVDEPTREDDEPKISPQQKPDDVLSSPFEESYTHGDLTNGDEVKTKLTLNLPQQNADQGEASGDISADTLVNSSEAHAPLSPPASVSIDVVDHLEQCLQNLPLSIQLDSSLEQLKQFDGEELMNLFYHDEAIPRTGNSKEELCHAMWTSLITTNKSKQSEDEQACLVLLTNQATYFITSGGEPGTYTTQNLSHGKLQKVVIGVQNQSVRLVGPSDQETFVCVTRDSSLGHIFVTRITFIVDTDFARPSHQLPTPEASGTDSEDELSIYDAPGRMNRMNSSTEHPSGVSFVVDEENYLQDLTTYLLKMHSSDLEESLKLNSVVFAHQLNDSELRPITLALTGNHTCLIHEHYSFNATPELLIKFPDAQHHFLSSQVIENSVILLGEFDREKQQLCLNLPFLEVITLQFSSTDSAESFYSSLLPQV